MKFRLLYDTFNKSTVKQEQWMVTVEIESLKFGRIWTIATLNPDTRYYEVTFQEDYWREWQDASQRVIASRMQFVRALITAQGVGIGLSRLNGALDGISILDWQLMIAEEVNSITASERRLTPAPTEQCMCSSENTGYNCEACADATRQSTLQPKPNLPDLLCDLCKAEMSCPDCNPGEFKYNYLTEISHTTCQPGLRLHEEVRMVTVHEGENVTLSCTVTANQHNAPVHQWRKLDSGSPAGTFQQSRLAVDPFTSEVTLIIQNAEQSHAGMYRCEAFSLLANVSQDYYVQVLNEPSRQLASVTLLDSNKRERQALYELRLHQNSRNSLTPNDIALGFRSKTGQPLTWKVIDQDPTTGIMRVQVELATVPPNGFPTEIDYFINSKSPYRSLYQTGELPTGLVEMRSMDINALSLSKNLLYIDFLQQDSISIVNPQEWNIKVKWYKLSPSSGEKEDPPLPVGSGQVKESLYIFAATEEHSGTYEAEIFNAADNSPVGKLIATVVVEPMLTESIALPNNNSAIHVNTRLPGEEFCPNRKWFLFTNNTNQLEAIPEEKVNTADNGQVTLWVRSNPDQQKVVMTCAAVPGTNLHGRLLFHLEPRNGDAVEDYFLRIIGAPLEGTLYYSSMDNITVACEARDSKSGVLRSDVSVQWKSAPPTEWSELSQRWTEDDGKLNLILLKAGAPKVELWCEGEIRESGVIKRSPSFQFQESYGPFVTIESSLNSIDLQNGKKVVNVLERRPLELICNVRSVPEAQNIRWLLMYQVQTDVPQPPFAIELTRENQEKRGMHISLNATTGQSVLRVEQFLSINLRGDLVCTATRDSRNTSDTIMIKKEEEKTEVKISGDKSEYAVLENSNLTLGCFMTDKASGSVIESMEYEWNFTDTNKRVLDLTTVVRSVSTAENNITLVGFHLTGQQDYFYGYCTAKYNRTFYDQSYVFNVRIYRQHQVLSIEMMKLEPLNKGEIAWDSAGNGSYTYDANDDTVIKCVGRFMNSNDSAVQWEKCLDPHCEKVEVIRDELLRFLGGFTKATDVGLYRCRAAANLLPFAPDVKYLNIIIDREAPPQLSYMNNVSPEIGASSEIVCQEENASPPAKMSFTFMPDGSLEFGPLPEEAVVTQKSNRLLVLSYPSTQSKHVGTYQCTAENAFKTVSVTAKLSTLERWNKKFFAVYY